MTEFNTYMMYMNLQQGGVVIFPSLVNLSEQSQNIYYR